MSATTREDGRSNDELRELAVHFDGLARVDGSARFGFGKHAQALASLSGPIEARLAQEQPSQSILEVLIRPLSGVSSTESKSLAATISSSLIPSIILTQNPRTLIQLVIQTLTPASNVGKWKDGLVASMINAGTLALMNAGSVPMKGVVCAVAVGRISSGDGDASPVYVVDPNDSEIQHLDAGGCFAFLFADGLGPNASAEAEPGAVCVWTNWRALSPRGFDERELVQTRGMALQAAKEVRGRMKECIQDMVSPPQKMEL